MTTRISTLVAAVAALGAAAVFAAPVQAGTGPGPNFSQSQNLFQYSGNAHSSGYATVHNSSDWNRGGQIKDQPTGGAF
jgi:hypothetical protein